MASGSLYFDPTEYTKWRFFDPDTLNDDFLRKLEARARFYRDGTDLAVLYNSPFAISNNTNMDFLCALLTEKEEAHERLEAWADSIIHCLELILDAVGDYVDVIAFAGDAGTQTAVSFIYFVGATTAATSGTTSHSGLHTHAAGCT